MYERVVSIQNIWKLMNKKEDIDPYEILVETERFYRSVKVFGIKGTMICYMNEEGNLINESGQDIPSIAKAIAAFIIRLFNCNNCQMCKIGEDFGIQTELEEALVEDFDSKQVFQNCSTVQEFIDVYININV